MALKQGRIGRRRPSFVSGIHYDSYRNVIHVGVRPLVAGSVVFVK